LTETTGKGILNPIYDPCNKTIWGGRSENLGSSLQFMKTSAHLENYLPDMVPILHFLMGCSGMVQVVN